MAKIFALSKSERLVNLLTDKPGKISIQKFSDGEIKVELLDSVRGKKVIIIGSLTNSDSIMELVMAGDAAKRASAKSVTALIPYLPYMRQDRKDSPRTAIGARVIANMIEVSYDQLITLDLHADQIEGFFNIPVTHIYGRTVFCPFLKENHDLSNAIMVSPDVGGAKRAKKFAKELGIPLAIINKEREMANQVSSMELMGNVDGKDVIIVDDMVDTAGSLCKAADTLLENGAKSVMSCITHGVLSGPALERIKNSNLTKLYITDSIDRSDMNLGNKIEIVSCSNIFKSTLQTIKDKKSIEDMMFKFTTSLK